MSSPHYPKSLLLKQKLPPVVTIPELPQMLQVLEMATLQVARGVQDPADPRMIVVSLNAPAMCADTNG